jgi:hypothetical protein
MADGQGVDSGAEGFLSIFRPGDQTGSLDSTTQSDTPTDAAAPDQGTPAAATSAPETDDSLSDEERVAARFASLEDEASDIPEPGQEVASDDDEEDTLFASDDDDLDLDSMTPEQMRELAEEALRLREEEAETSQAEVAAKVQAAEQEALEAVQSDFQREVIQAGQRHYRAIRNRQIAQLVKQGLDRDNPAQEILAGIDGVLNNILTAQTQWEQKMAQSEEWTGRVQQAVIQARGSVPELRKAYAEQLVEERQLPKAAVDYILKTKGGKERHIDDFEERADELLATARTLGKVRAKGRQETKEEGRKRLIEQRVATVATSRPRREEPVEYKGTAREGLAILQRLRS